MHTMQMDKKHSIQKASFDKKQGKRQGRNALSKKVRRKKFAIHTSYQNKSKLKVSAKGQSTSPASGPAFC